MTRKTEPPYWNGVNQASEKKNAARKKAYGHPSPSLSRQYSLAAPILGINRCPQLLMLIRLTYHPTTCSTADDRPAHGTKSEIEVTPEMIEAGLRILNEGLKITYNVILVGEIYKAMARAIE